MISHENLSDKYEDQISRFENAMIELFKYESLLNNEYLVRKFEMDLVKPNHYLLQYVVVQRETSIKNQYVQNQQNDRKQYHSQQLYYYDIQCSHKRFSQQGYMNEKFYYLQ